MQASSRLAWLLRAVCAAQAAAALTFFAWRWPAAPGQAVAGAAAIALIGPVLLAAEFFLLAVFGRGDRSVAAASGRELLSAWLSESLHLVQVFYGRLPFRWRLPADQLSDGAAGRTGVVLIHGFVCNRGLWAPWLRQLGAQRYACVAVNLEPVFASIDAYVATIEQAVRRVETLTGRPPILVCHSMGGLAARAWWRAHGVDGRVARIITIGSPHHGTWLARFSRMPNGRQMRQRNAWLAALELSETRRPLPPCTCWYSNCDNIVFPARTASLPHADNRLLPGVAHVALAFHPAVIADTMRHLATSVGAEEK